MNEKFSKIIFRSVYQKYFQCSVFKKFLSFTSLRDILASKPIRVWDSFCGQLLMLEIRYAFKKVISRLGQCFHQKNFQKKFQKTFKLFLPIFYTLLTSHNQAFLRGAP